MLGSVPLWELKSSKCNGVWLQSHWKANFKLKTENLEIRIHSDTFDKIHLPAFSFDMKSRGSNYQNIENVTKRQAYMRRSEPSEIDNFSLVQWNQNLIRLSPWNLHRLRLRLATPRYCICNCICISVYICGKTWKIPLLAPGRWSVSAVTFHARCGHT